MKRFSVTVNGVAYDVTVEEVGGVASAPVAAPVAAPAPAAAPAAPVAAPAPAAAPAGPAGAVAVKAPLQGTVMKVLVKAGDKVVVGNFVGGDIKLDGVEYKFVKLEDVLAIVTD